LTYSDGKATAPTKEVLSDRRAIWGTFPTYQHLNLTKNTDFRSPVSRPAIRVFLFN
jgi:hypothetical protein